MMPRLQIGASCWAAIRRELDRVLPHEGLVVPLLAAQRRRPLPDPCAPINLADLRRLVIARAVRIPAELQVNTFARVSVLPSTDALINQEVATIIDRHPALRPCAYLHSHPFARGWTRPSRGLRGDVEGHMLPLLARNQQSSLNAAFSFIACGEASQSLGVSSGGWLLQGFALVGTTSGGHHLVDLGLVQPVPDDCAAMRRALLPPLAHRTPWRFLLRRWRRQLRRQGGRIRSDELFGGWQRVVVSLGQGRDAVVLLPIDFPREQARIFVVERGRLTRELHLDAPFDLSPGAWERSVQPKLNAPVNPAQEVLHVQPRCA
jgi:hypothetical protein